MNLQQTIRRILKESDKELRFVYNPKNDRVIGFNIESEDELNNIIYDENGHNRGYGWGLQLKDNQSIKFDSLQDAQQWYQEKNGDRITKETQNSKYPELSFIALNLRKIDGLDYDIINRGSCFKFAKEISELGYNTFTFIFSNEDQEVIHVYIKLTNNLYFDATGFHTKKEIKQDYINGEDNEMYDSDISELNHYCNLDTYSALSTIPISNQLWKKVINVINKSRMNLQESIRRILREETRFQKMGEDKYKSCSMSDITRMEIIDDFFNRVSNDPNYNIDEPDYDMLLDDWDGYDDQVYIQNKLDNDTIIFYEGWVDSCWSAVYNKPQYKGMSKKQVIKDIITNRFPRIAEEFNMYIDDYGYINDDGYIMYVVMKKY